MLQPPKLSRTIFPQFLGRSGVIPQIALYMLVSAQLPMQQRSKDSIYPVIYRLRQKEIRACGPQAESRILLGF